MKNQQIKSAGELRKFSVIMALPLAAIGILMLWRGRFLGPYAIALAVLFLLFGMLFPKLLNSVERIWMAFARVLSIIMTHVLLTLTFFLIITPFGLAMRLMGKDILHKRFDSKKESYWVPVEQDGPCSRPDKPY